MRGCTPTRWAAVTLCAFGLLGPDAEAVDGVLEINQACAVNTGCFSGDAAGLPVTISASGSYRLTGNLAVSSGNTTAIEITTDFVGLDLNGFSISGVTTCSPPTGPVTSCSSTGTGAGIRSTRDGIAVERGFVRGMGSQGIELVGGGSLVRGVGVTSNGNHGIQLGATGIVRDSVSSRNGADGIHVADGSQVTNSFASGNADDGIEVLSASHVVDNHTSENGTDGIHATSGCLVRGNVSVSNLGTGIEVLQDSVVLENSSSYNGVGLDLGAPGGTSPSAYAGNVLNENATAVANGANGLETGNNVCADDTTCP